MNIRVVLMETNKSYVTYVRFAFRNNLCFKTHYSELYDMHIPAIKQQRTIVRSSMSNENISLNAEFTRNRTPDISSTKRCT